MKPLERPLRADARRNRQQIVEAAREAFMIDGIGVSLDEIARRAGVGPGTVHRHFPTKKQLYDAIVALHLDELRREAQAALDGGDKDRGFFPYLTGLVGRAGPEQDVTEALAAAGVEPGPGAQQAAAELRDVLGALLSAAQESGVVRSDVNAEDVRAVVVAALAAQRYRGDDGRIADLILGCLRP
ncbi:TetR/AcrR family transcriptional regulator [Nocardia sp. CA-119907]|uniref:TetR/AcrR family transcriptional regulator n=1 Tax=Nocardia sp. CA-119907 TaxID=3239973 RepID=UPI003D95DF0C